MFSIQDMIFGKMKVKACSQTKISKNTDHNLALDYDKGLSLLLFKYRQIFFILCIFCLLVFVQNRVKTIVENGLQMFLELFLFTLDKHNRFSGIPFLRHDLLSVNYKVTIKNFLVVFEQNEKNLNKKIETPASI